MNSKYPADRAIKQIDEVIRLMVTRGSLTHDECEAATVGKPCGKITTIRSQISDIRYDLHWPIKRVMESHGNGTHARYSIDFQALSKTCPISAEALKELALKAISEGFVLHFCQDFVDYAKTHRAKDLRLSHAIYDMKVKGGGVQLGIDFAAGGGPA